MTQLPEGGSSTEHAKHAAEGFVAYFEGFAVRLPGENLRRGLDTAREWLRLIEATSVSREEIATLLGVVQANQHRGSGWNSMAICVYSWAAKRGYPVPSAEEFVDHREWSREALAEDVSSARAAEILVNHFERRTLQDPKQETWELGLATARTWRRLIQSHSVSPSELSALLETVRTNTARTITHDWWVLEHAVYRWSATGRDNSRALTSA
jgi:hypothetical protein